MAANESIVLELPTSKVTVLLFPGKNGPPLAMVMLSPVAREPCKVHVLPTSANSSRPGEASEPVSKKSFDPSWNDNNAGASPRLDGPSTVIRRRVACDEAGIKAPVRMSFLYCVFCNMAMGRAAGVPTYSGLFPVSITQPDGGHLDTFFRE